MTKAMSVACLQLMGCRGKKATAASLASFLAFQSMNFDIVISDVNFLSKGFRQQKINPFANSKKELERE